MTALPYSMPITDSNGMPTRAFLQYLQQSQAGAIGGMPAPPPVVINADSTGTITDSMPRYVAVKRLYNGNDVTAQSQWAMAVASGTITAVIDNTGKITISAFPGVSAVLQVKSTFRSVPMFCNVPVSKAIAAAPSSGPSGGSSSSTTSFTSINSASHVAIISPLTVTVGASGTVNLTAPLTVKTAQAAPTGFFPVFGKWQWNNSGVWTDVAAEVQTSPDADVTFEYPIYSEDDGYLTANTSKSGLTPAANIQFRLMARNGSGTRTMTFSGTATATPQ